MTATATLQILAPLSHQEPIYESPAPRKILRWGRRSGKTRFAFTSAVVGHGPEHPTREGGRTFPGILAGYDVAWLCPDYPQAAVVWNEEIEPRFRGVRGVSVNASQHTVSLAGAGTLYVATAGNLDAIRGKGARLIGVIVDEAAHLDLRAALLSVIYPTLLDHATRGSWLILSSTTNSGHDGNADQVAPSYFNTLCEECETGQRDPDQWAHSYAIATDNPVIDEGAFRELVAEYPADSIQLDEEIFARLLAPGAGLAFPEWSRAIHATTFRPELDRDVEWRWFAGGDWGYASYGALTLCAAGPDRKVVVRHCYRFNGPEATRAQKGLTPYEVGRAWAITLQNLALPEWLALDPSAWAVTQGGPTIAEELQRGIADVLRARAFPVLQPPRGPGSRVAGKLLVHEALRYERPKGLAPDAPLPSWAYPRLSVHSEDASYLVETLPTLPRDAKNPEDVDTDADDHGYDSLRYGLMARQPQVHVGAEEDWSTHQHPGVRPPSPDHPTQPRRHRESFEDRMREDDVVATARRSIGWRRGPGGITYDDGDGGLYE